MYVVNRYNGQDYTDYNASNFLLHSIALVWCGVLHQYLNRWHGEKVMRIVFFFFLYFNNSFFSYVNKHTHTHKRTYIHISITKTHTHIHIQSHSNTLHTKQSHSIYIHICTYVYSVYISCYINTVTHFKFCLLNIAYKYV